jgi:glycine cleavage system H lipoate-binding protein
MHMDLFATKGLEYLLVITYLTLLMAFWAFALKPAKPKEAKAPTPVKVRGAGWFSLPKDFHFHQGHTWAVKEAPGVLRVGMDEFARRLLGSPSALHLPLPGTHLEQGHKGWSVEVGGKSIDMLSPVGGEVIEVNTHVMDTPGEALINPFDEGWLLRVRVDPERCPLRNLLSGDLALAWLRNKEEMIRTHHAGELGVVLPDGGAPVDGFAQALSPDGWEELARTILIPDPC